ncbi:MAG: hypothetical protein EBS32_12025, partial [Actinobacteria bacterium]|nr:hypothetical protein [Actinomycetota bacterium]
MDMAATGVDVIVTAPQKGWSGPAGCALVMLSERARTAIDGTTSTSFSADLKKWLSVMETYESGAHVYHTTMPTDALSRVAAVMRETQDYGFEKLREEQWALGRGVRDLLASFGYASVAGAGFEAPGVVVSYTDDPELQSSKKFLALGLQTASGVPLQILPPSAPRFLYASVSGTSVGLSWSIPLTANGDAVSGYEVWQSTDGTNFSRVTTLAATVRAYALSGLSSGGTYSFYVKALNSIGASAPSNTVTAQPRIAGAPSAPGSLGATVNNTSVTLAWSPSSAQASAPVTDYIVEYAVSPSNTFVVFNDGVSTTTSARITGLTPDVQVAFRVKARNKFGDSPYSSTVTATPRALLSAPSAPQSLGVTAGDARVGVSWSAPASDGGSAITAYNVTATNGSSVAGTCSTTGALSCIVSGLTNGVTYSFSATATNAIGTS